MHEKRARRDSRGPLLSCYRRARKSCRACIQSSLYTEREEGRDQQVKQEKGSGQDQALIRSAERKTNRKQKGLDRENRKIKRAFPKQKII